MEKVRVLWYDKGEIRKTNIQPTIEEIESFIGAEMRHMAGAPNKNLSKKGMGAMHRNNAWSRESRLGKFFDKTKPLYVYFKGWTATGSELAIADEIAPDLIGKSFGYKIVLVQGGRDLQVRPEQSY